jgi:hypothetical protein
MLLISYFGWGGGGGRGFDQYENNTICCLYQTTLGNDAYENTYQLISCIKFTNLLATIFTSKFIKVA